jgi:hypothetical protein
MAEMREFDPRLVMEANRSLSFIFRAFDAFKANPALSVGTIIGPHISGNRCDLINPGLVLAAPRETAFDVIDLDGIDLSSFDPAPPEAHRMLRRLRNPLSHGRFSIDDLGIFTFRDHKPDGADPFVLRVHFADLGTFVDSFGRRAIEAFRSAAQAVVH